MYGQKQEWEIEAARANCALEDYQGAAARWCPGCGDHAVLNAVQRLARDLQLPPEKTVCVSGIGCSSRFPHYMSTYGFHGLHGRAFPVACGVRARRPDLHIFMVPATATAAPSARRTGSTPSATTWTSPSCCSTTISTASPRTRRRPPREPARSRTPIREGSVLPPLNPLSVTLGINNASFVAQTIDWNPPHLYNTIKAAHEHKGLSFVRVLQRCPHFTSHVFAGVQQDLSQVLLMTHEEGIPLDANIARLFPNRAAHNPRDLHEARNDRRARGRLSYRPVLPQ